MEDGVTQIGYLAFGYCDQLSSVTIPDSVTNIGKNAFWDCISLTDVTIPRNVTVIGENAFGACPRLTAFSVDANNPVYADLDGVLYSKDGKTVICYPKGRSGAYEIPGGVTAIASNGFYDCTKLTSVTIPNSVTSIGDYAFNSCYGLKDVYYGGTEAQWAAITIGDFNSQLTKATIHFESTVSE